MARKNKYISLFFVIFCLFFNCSGSNRGVNKLLHADGLWIKDQDNRVMILRGINVGGDAKLPPFLPFDTEASADQIAGWGMNLVRYLVTWEGIEPEKGVYSEEYLDEVEKRVNWLTDRGIFVFIDFHQDLFARKAELDTLQSWIDAAKKSPVSAMSKYASRLQDQQGRLDALKKALEAYVASGQSMQTYTVGTWAKDRDCLWNIAKKPKIYANPFLWPKIWQGNRDQIKNPDVIEPGQKLKIPPKADLTKDEKSAVRKYWSKKEAVPAPTKP